LWYVTPLWYVIIIIFYPDHANTWRVRECKNVSIDCCSKNQWNYLMQSIYYLMQSIYTEKTVLFKDLKILAEYRSEN